MMSGGEEKRREEKRREEKRRKLAWTCNSTLDVPGGERLHGSDER